MIFGSLVCSTDIVNYWMDAYCVTPQSTELRNEKNQPLKVVSRYRDP